MVASRWKNLKIYHISLIWHTDNSIGAASSVLGLVQILPFPHKKG